MQQPHRWPMMNHGPAFFYQSRPETEHHAGYDSSMLQSHHKYEDGPWAEQMHIGQISAMSSIPCTAGYSDLSGSTLTPSPQPQLFGSGLESIPGHAQSPAYSLKHSPALTSSSLASDVLPISTIHPTPVECYPAPSIGVEYPGWKGRYDQHLYSMSIHPAGGVHEYHHPTQWPISCTDSEDTSSQSSLGHGRLSNLHDEPAVPQRREAMVQAILDRTRRTKTTDENAKYHCEQCGKGFQRIYNLRSHMTKHIASRLKVQCEHRDCGKHFDRKTDLARHERSVHLKQKDYCCPICSSFFARKDTLVRHIEGSCSKRVGVNRRRLKNLLTPSRVEPATEKH